ncbi:MAG: cytochrome C oxidase subunit IV family protein [Saprospiraceae bacterium]|nr:cytochrome C oxidase subunit IV family protein [Saprospiraceae bacterium]
MSHLSYEESIKRVYYGLRLLAIVTLAEVFISLLGKGHIIPGAEKYAALLYIAGLVIIVLSAYKAYFIIYEFMHMKYEVKSLALTVLLPTVLLIWAIIAFFQEGDSWKDRREQIKEKNAQPAQIKEPQGMHIQNDIYTLENLM